MTHDAAGPSAASLGCAGLNHKGTQMRIVGFEEFCSLPEGTVFSYWEPCQASGLYRRGEVISFDGAPRDFYEASLKAKSCNGEPPVVDLIESRWGLFEYEQQFLVYDKDDIAVIAEGLGIARAEHAESGATRHER
jgi:hypothetical protein